MDETGPSESSVPPPSKPLKRSSSSRSTYSRPCDACSLRKVKCDLKSPSCSRCVEHDLPCTNIRIRKKCGPKHIHKKTRASIIKLSRSSESDNHENLQRNTLGHQNNLLPCLQIYQTWFYGVWPVVSVAYLMSKIVRNDEKAGFSTDFNVDSISAYSLSCAVSAAIICQVTFLSSSTHLISLPPDIKHAQFANEAIKARDSFNYRLHPSPDTLLTSFFLYAYYINIKGGAPAAICYLREAISIAQILGLHNSNNFVGKSSAEVHRLRKIYYLLLVTERFICIEDDIPVILEPSIPFPSLLDEEYSSLLTGFTELVKIFAIPDKKFFDKFISLKIYENDNSNFPSRTWIINVQQQLETIPILQETLSIQKLNIVLSKYWMKSLTWNISKKNNLLIDSGSITQSNSSLSAEYPLEIVRDFLEDTKDLPLYSFESNGPGVCIKLLELGNSLADSISLTRNYRGIGYLSSIFDLVSKLKNDITLPIHLLMLPSWPITAASESYISEIPDEEEIGDIHNNLETSKVDPVSPFTQMAMAFSMSPAHLESSNAIVEWTGTDNNLNADSSGFNTQVEVTRGFSSTYEIEIQREGEQASQNMWF
ncbi:uncharacterized protein RJT20DRAFT_146400 [Scheffersomyces xylosifermentans]|uniref:uncharacterized protein n=1 Tax=Scheffersomyces xylosifermentans TaxID=1304137 RepID=UPI00315C9059